MGVGNSDRVYACPEQVDEAIRESLLLQRVAAALPPLAVGPLDIDRQFWVIAERPQHLPARRGGPAVTRFEAPRGYLGGGKPKYGGFFTSTGFSDSYGMWWYYLIMNQGSLFPRPWQAWHIRPSDSARIHEIGNAMEWTQFVMTYPLDSDGALRPNWAAAARDHDAVHLTLTAVAATQGLSLRVADGVTAPTYWDVESTIWLNWVFVEAIDLTNTMDRRLERLGYSAPA